MKNKLLQKKIQPFLLDRLTDNKDNQAFFDSKESTYSIDQLRQSIERDLQWLFETIALSANSSLAIEDYEHIPSSVINYGIPDIIGAIARSIDEKDLEKKLTLAIQRFEPRIIKESIKLKVNIAKTKASTLDELFEIQLDGMLWAQPRHVPFKLKRQVTMVSSHR